MSDKPTDSMQPWTIKSFPVAVKKVILDAAHDERLTVGQWLEKRVNEWVNQGKPVVIAGENKVANQVENMVADPVNRTMTDEERRAQTLELARVAASLSLPGQAESALLTTARIRVRAELLALPKAPSGKITGSETQLTALPAPSAKRALAAPPPPSEPAAP